MASELLVSGLTTGSVAYALIRNLTGSVYSSVGPAFEAQNGANLANYARTLTENGTTGVFFGDFPALAAGRYHVEYRLRAGGSPAWTDSVIGFESLDWSGTAIIGVGAGGSAPTAEAVAQAVWEYVPQELAPTPNTLEAGELLVMASAADAAPTAGAIADAVWDEARSGHVADGSFGRALAGYDSTARAGTATTIQLASAETAIPTNRSIHLVDGTGAGQSRIVTGYDGGTKTATVHLAWTTNPDATTKYYLGDVVQGGAMTVSDKTGFKLAADGVDLVVIETGVNLRQGQSAILAAAAGLLSGAGTGTITIKGGNVATTRIVATTDDSGNRSAVTLILPS